LSIFEKLTQNTEKNSICDDKKNLRSRYEKKFFKFVTIFFLIFRKNDLDKIFYYIKMEINGNQKTPKNADFSCEKCAFKCIKKSEWVRHCQTIKHIHRHNGNFGNKMETKKTPDHICKCGKQFMTKSGYWKHHKVCALFAPDGKNDIILHNKTKSSSEKDELIQLLINDNKEFKQMMVEMVKNSSCGANNSFNNNVSNSHNKTFNLQVFLNETCKDAMNIMDFVNSMEINLDDLEKVGELGYVNGMTNIILKNLKALDITKRPLHCTDAKRETLYIKDKDKWEKETENKDKMKLALKYIVHKNAKMFNVFKAKYPDCIKSYSNRCDQYNKLVVEVLGGKGDNEMQNNEKIIRRIAREVTIDKSL
jgi:hypothetical protein